MLKIFNSILFVLVLLIFLELDLAAQTDLTNYGDFDWKQVAELPGSEAQRSSLGFAGMFAGTQLSAITFMAIPSETFATDWTLFWLLMTIIMVSPIIICWFLPFFKRLNLTSAYEYLELRFDKTIRFLGSLGYIALQLGRLGIVLLLPSLALAVITGIDVMACIL